MPTKQEKPRRRVTGVQKAHADLGMRIVGPASPAERLDRRDREKDREEYEAWTSVRSALVSIGKRFGIESVEKKPGVDEAYPAQATPPDDDNPIRGQRSDMVDDIITPPFDFTVLCTLLENSNSLRQNIDAMVTNIDGFGHTFVPAIDFTDPEVNNTIRDMLLHQRIEDDRDLASKDLLDLSDQDLERLSPSIDEVEKIKQRWARIAAIEKQRAASFFEFVNPLQAFVRVRRSMRESRELLGNAGFEIIRENPADVTSKIIQVYAVPFLNMRLVRIDSRPTPVEARIRKDPIRFGTMKVERYFRRYVRVDGLLDRIYYKEFGDPRVVSRKTGHYYKTLEELKEQEPEALPAHEFYHWKIDSQISPYGVPRWIGSLLSVLGSRAAEEVNFLYFDNKAIPPMVMLVSGGKLSDNSVKRIESYIDERLKGRRNFHKILVLEGLPAGAVESGGDVEASGKVRVELKPLMGNQIQDALFQQYDQNNMLKVGRAWRQPQILTGDTRDMNRSTADVAKAFAEEQIYQPERDDFDAMIDRDFMTNLGIHFWRFKTNAPVQRIPNDLVKNVSMALERGAITANEARKVLSDAFSITFEQRREEWAKMPAPLALAAARMGGMPGVEPMLGDFAEGQEGEEAFVEGRARVRAADTVPVVDGDLVARGQTEVADGHSHTFVAVRRGGQVVFMLLPGGEDDHTHTVEPVPFAQGKDVETETSTDHGHAHDLSFTAPLSKKRRRAQRLALALHGMHLAMREELAEQMDDFFDPTKLQSGDDED